MVMFEYDGDKDVTSSDDAAPNTEDSIPAGLGKADGYNLIVTYKPDGDMSGADGAGQFELRIPTGWSAEDVLIRGDESSILPDAAVESGDTITSTLPKHFGETADYSLIITLVDITVPNEFGNQRFTARAKHEGGRLTPLKVKPSAFVGNTRAGDGTVTVNIKPDAAYEKETSVDFEIEITANGPMHDGRIQVVMPDAFDRLDDTSGEPNYVRVSTSVRDVTHTIEGVDDRVIISTGDLDSGETITVRIEDVDIPDDVSTSTQFQVGTKTRAPKPTVADPMPIDDDDRYKSIADANITGGVIRTIVGSGMMAVKPANVEQGSRNVNFDLKFTAATDFKELDLKIEVPNVFDTELQGKDRSGDGYVTFIRYGKAQGIGASETFSGRPATPLLGKH